MNDGLVYFLVVLPLVWVLANISSFLIIIFHELSHAVPALIFTKQDVTIYIGTYGDNNGFKFKIGKLIINIKLKFSYLKSGGVCVYKPIQSLYKDLIILIAGPLITTVIALLLFKITFLNDLHGSIKAFTAILLGSSIISLVVNLYPRKINTNAKTYYSDGYNIFHLLNHNKNFRNLKIGCKYCDENDYLNAIIFFERLDDTSVNESVFRLMISCYIQIKNYNTAKKFIDKYILRDINTQLNDDDYCNIAYIEIQLENFDSALTYLNKSIELNQSNVYGLNNRGFLNNIKKNYPLAIVDLTNSIKLDPNNFYSYCNRAYSFIKLDLLDEALVDINKSFELDKDNSYAFSTMGSFFYKKGEFVNALENFEKAKQIDESTMFIEANIKKAKEKILLSNLTNSY